MFGRMLLVVGLLMIGGCSPLHRQAFFGGVAQGVRGDMLPAAPATSKTDELNAALTDIVKSLLDNDPPAGPQPAEAAGVMVGEVTERLIEALGAAKAPGTEDAVLAARLGWAGGTVLAAIASYMGFARPLRHLLTKFQPLARLPPASATAAPAVDPQTAATMPAAEPAGP